MCACFGDEPDENLEVLIGQMVNLVKDGEPLRMSKRAGTVITIDDLVDAVGVDAGRYALVRSSSTPRSTSTSTCWTQAATTTRCTTCSTRTPGSPPAAQRRRPRPRQGRPSTRAARRTSARASCSAPSASSRAVVASAAELREPHRVARYLEELAGTYHRFYDACRVLPRGDEEPTDVHRARLWLVEATRTVLANGLGLLGVTAPDRM